MENSREPLSSGGERAQPEKILVIYPTPRIGGPWEDTGDLNQGVETRSRIIRDRDEGSCVTQGQHNGPEAARAVTDAR